MHQFISLKMSIVMFMALMLITGTVFGQKWGDVSEEERQMGPPADYPEANSIILFDKGHIAITLQNIRIDYHVRIKVLTQAGVEEVGDRSISFDKEDDKFKDFKAQTITPEGKKIKVEKEALFEKTADEYIEKTFSFPSVSVGSILEYKYSIISENHYYLKPWYFQGGIYTQKSQLAVTIPNGFTYTVQFQNVPPQFREPALKEAIDADAGMTGAKIKTFTWTRENLPPITNEPYMSAISDYWSALRFQLQGYEDSYNFINFQKTWPERGEQCQTWLDEYCNKDGDIKKLADEITVGLTSDRRKSEALYAYVAANFKTRNQYHNWLFMHDKIGMLLSERHGSAEGKNVLLCELHNAVGIPAFPVMISRRSNGQFYADFAYLPQFDYIIAFVQMANEYEFLDASSRLSPYGVLPPDCLVDGGLLVDGKNSQLVRINQKSFHSERTDRTRIHIASDGTAACSTSCNFKGYLASFYGNRYESNDPREFVEDYFLDKLDAAYTLGEYRCELDTALEFVMTMDYTSDELVEKLDNNLLVKMIAYDYRTNPFKARQRSFPVDFQYPFTYRNVLEVVGDGAVLETIPPGDLSFACGGATFERKTTAQGSVVVVDSRLTIEKPQFLPIQYDGLRMFFDKIALSTGDDLVLVTSGGE